jgi:hypothetical protein
MAHAYTPGLRVAEKTVLRKERRLPLPGEILVKEGDMVKADQIVARTHLPGTVTAMNIANKLGIPPDDLPQVMRKKEGDPLKKDETIAQSRGFFGLFKSTVRSPIDGSVESISSVTGQVLLREPPMPVEIDAYIDSKVIEIYGKEGVIVETVAAFIQGIFGIGRETKGSLRIAVDSPDTELSEDLITPEDRGKIIIGGSFMTLKAMRKAMDLKVAGMITGGVNAQDVKEVLGYDLGVAITGSEDIPTTFIVTEGFGPMNMAERTFNLFRSNEGKRASMNGATQIRAGVIRPEVVITIPELMAKDLNEAERKEGGLDIGSEIRVIREPFFGRLGKVSALPVQLTVLDSESKARVLEVEFGDGEKAIIPRANVELIER